MGKCVAFQSVITGGIGTDKEFQIHASKCHIQTNFSDGTQVLCITVSDSGCPGAVDIVSVKAAECINRCCSALNGWVGWVAAIEDVRTACAACATGQCVIITADTIGVFIGYGQWYTATNVTEGDVVAAFIAIGATRTC